MTERGPSLEAVLAAARQGPAPVEVAGSGELAQELRAQLGTSGEGRAGTIVETTGELSSIELAMARVEDLGTIVLAGPPMGEDATVDLYSDIHVRGLTVIALVPGR